MENELFAVAKEIKEIEIALERAKSQIFKKEPNVSSILDIAFHASSLLDKVVDKLEDIEMGEVDFSNINLDKHFEGNPVSEYVQAGIEYASGDDSAIERMMGAFSKISEEQKGEKEETEYVELLPAEALKSLKENDEHYYGYVNECLKGIEEYFEGTVIDNWDDTEVELARYFLQFKGDTTSFNVEGLNPQGVKLAWKRRRYVGAAK